MSRTTFRLCSLLVFVMIIVIVDAEIFYYYPDVNLDLLSALCFIVGWLSVGPIDYLYDLYFKCIQKLQRYKK